VILRAYRRHRFPQRYTRANIELLPAVDEAHETLSGPATQKILERELYEFHDERYKRLARLSVAQLYRLRKSRTYRQRRVAYQPTRPTQGQEICVPGFASGGLRKLDTYAGAVGGIRGGGARDFSAHSGRVGQDGTYPYSPRRGEPGCTDRRIADRVETADRDEPKDTRQEAPCAGARRSSKQQTREAMT
jgi:hypothetical protein